MPHMYVVHYDDIMRAARAKGITYERIDTVYENTPEFERLWEEYVASDDPMYHICTEPDGRTHTFFRIHLPETENNNDEETNGEADQRASVPDVRREDVPSEAGRATASASGRSD